MIFHYRTPPVIESYDPDVTAMISAIERGESLHSVNLLDSGEPYEPFKIHRAMLIPLKGDALPNNPPHIRRRKPLRLTGVAYIGSECQHGGYWSQTGPSELTWTCSEHYRYG